jgi:hypothetical protein
MVQFLFRMINAAITPGTQPRQVSMKTIRILPQPLSNIAKGGRITARITLQILIMEMKVRDFKDDS